MQTRSPRTLLAISAAVALSVSALAPTVAFAMGPGPGAADRDGDCTSETGEALQVRARGGAATQTAAGGRGQARARVSDGATAFGEGARNWADEEVRAGRGPGGQAAAGAGRGWDEDALRGPEYCDECDAEMGTLSEADIAGLVFMANEEKMAHDVYATFATMYDVPVFERIAQSEARHQLAVDTVLERYAIEDDTSGLAQGEFSDDAIQQLYDELIAKGSASLEEAIAVGVLIEETDIADLEVRVAGYDEMTSLEVSAPDVFEMYSNLLTASSQHLAAFQRQQ